MNEHKLENFCSVPCNDCPYRKDAPLQLWHKVEFKTLLEETANEQWGRIYGCHKGNGNICAGWLTNQFMQDLPNLNLRLWLLKMKTTREQMEELELNQTNLYESIFEMVKANYPELLKKEK